jgi:putative hydrolase of the HAD superfamily
VEEFASKQDGPVPLKAVAFDVDGTLYPNASMYLRSLGSVLRHWRLYKALETARVGMRETPDQNEDFYLAQGRAVGAILGLSAEEAQARIEDVVYTRWFRVFTRLRPYRGLTGCLKDFRARGLKLAVLSDFPIRRRLDDLGLGPWDCAMSTEETGCLKPNPQSFLVLADRLGVAPHDMLYVGNSYRYDVLGAAAAGLSSAHLTRRPVAGSPAVLQFRHYAELREYVLRTLADSSYNTSGRVSV